MTTYMALDKDTNDLILPTEGGISRVKDGRFVVQQVSSRLKTWLGEWALDPTVGWLNIDDFKKQYDLFDIEDKAKVIILSTQGVNSVIDIHSILHKRVLTVYITAHTIYGEISLDVPWGLT
jgi:hypothetical protein